VSLVTDDALCICELADILEMPQSTISSHVQIIRKAGLLESEKCEKWTYFRIEKKYLRLIRSMKLLFEESEDSLWKDDAKKAGHRLAQRDDSCCPGPQNLSPRKKTQTTIKS
jgi:DNA-binding transcriptional ArsR family regulator